MRTSSAESDDISDHTRWTRIVTEFLTLPVHAISEDHCAALEAMAGNLETLFDSVASRVSALAHETD